MKVTHVSILIVLIVVYVVLIDAAFDVAPVSANVFPGETAEFRCQHSTANSVDWMVDGSMVDIRNLPPDVNVGTVGPLSRLTIVARPEYNGTEVVCVAGDDVSFPAVLYISDIPPSTTMPTTTPPTTTTQQAETNPTDNTAGSFIVSPLSVTVVVSNETTTTFHCEHSNADQLGWLINGTALGNQPDLDSTFRERPSGRVGSLTITPLSQYSSTVIECVAFFSNNQPSERTPTALLLIQGPLQAVTNLRRGYIGGDFQTYSWDPPPTLDLTGVEPDIAYCITIHNITCGKNDLVISECNIEVTFYRSQFIQPHLVYRVEVIPRSNVESARNGTPLSISETFMDIDIELSSTHFEKDDNSDNITVALKLNPNMMVAGNVIAPEQFTITVTAIDSEDKEPVKMSVVMQSQVSIITSSLPSRRLWKYEFLAYGCKEHLLGSINISTHDIQGVNVSSPQPGQVSVDGYFIEDSTASGVLVIATDGNSTSYHFIDRDSGRDSDRLNGDTKISGLPGGECIVSVFVVEGDGLAVKRAAAVPRNLIVENDNGANSSSSIAYELNSTSTDVCITCTFLESSTATDCVAVVHQPISSSAGLMNIESSQKFTRSGDTASGCIEGVNLKDYEVGVIGWRQLQSGLDAVPTKTTTIVGVTIGVIGVVVLLAIVIILSVVVIRNWESFKSDTEKGESASPNEYEPAPPTTNQRDRLIRVVADGGSRNTTNDMAGGPPPPPRTADGPPPPPRTADGPPPPPNTADGPPPPPRTADGPPPPPLTAGGPPPPPRTADGPPPPPRTADGPPPPPNTAAGAPPPPHLFHPGTTKPTDVGVSGQVNEAMYSTLAEASDTVNRPVAAGDQGNHSDIKHEEINGDQYAVVNKSKKVPESSVDAKGKKKPLVYSTVAAVAPPVGVPPTADKRVAYSTVQHEKEKGDEHSVVNKQESGGDGIVGETLIYSKLDVKGEAVHLPLNDDCVQYAVVKESKAQTVSTKPKKAFPAPPPLPARFTVDNLLPLLRPISSKWKEMSECIPLTEELIDEIGTNNETDEACLKDALGWYMKNGDLKHEWEEMVAILKKMDELQLADKIYDLYIHPYIVPLPGETKPTEKCHRQHSDGSRDSGIAPLSRDEVFFDNLKNSLMPVVERISLKDEWGTIVAVLKRINEPDKIQDILVNQYKLRLSGVEELLLGLRRYLGSSIKPGIGHSDIDSHNSTPSNCSDDEESVQQSGTASDTVTSTPVLQQTDLEQGTAGQTMLKKTEKVSYDKTPLPGQTLLSPKLIHSRIASNTDSGIGHSDSDSHNSTPSNSSDDEESVQQSGTASEPVTSTAVQQHTTDIDLEQGTCVHQSSDGRTHVRQANAYENASLNYLGDKQVVGTDVDPVRTGDKVVFEDDDELVSAVSRFQSDVASDSSHETSVTDELVEPGTPSEPEPTDYMEMLSACSSTTLNLSQSDRIRLLRHRRTASNHQSDELWQTQAKTYGTLSESGDSQVQTVTCENVKDTEDGAAKQIVLYVAHVQVNVRCTINV